jgi:hypothetical protein
VFQLVLDAAHGGSETVVAVVPEHVSSFGQTALAKRPDGQPDLLRRETLGPSGRRYLGRGGSLVIDDGGLILGGRLIVAVAGIVAGAGIGAGGRFLVAGGWLVLRGGELILGQIRRPRGRLPPGPRVPDRIPDGVLVRWFGFPFRWLGIRGLGRAARGLLVRGRLTCGFTALGLLVRLGRIRLGDGWLAVLNIGSG